MKIKNDYIKIKIGNKNYIFNNLILDTYLRHMAEIQEDFNNQYWQSPFLTKCYVKFDNKLEFDETSILQTTDFDLEFNMMNNYLKTSNDKNEIEYIYKTNSNLKGQRITTIGFFDEYGDTCYACLDLYDYSLIIKDNEDMVIFRKDTISTDAHFVSSSPKITYPIHLSPYGMEWNIDNPRTNRFYPVYGGFVSARLESVGLGINKNEIKKEIILNSENTEYFDNKIIFRNIFSNENLFDILEPNIKHPSNNLYPTNTENHFTYIFLKYQLYYNIYTYEGSSDYEHIYAGEWYTLSIPFKINGEFDYAIEYERSDNYGIQ